MMEKASLDGDVGSTEMAGSTSHASVAGPENAQEMADRQQDSKKNKVKDQNNKTAPFSKLFSFADSWDYLLMFVGTVSAAANGVSTPLMTIIIGDAIDAINTKQLVHEVSKVSLKFALLGAGAFVAAFL